MNVERNVLAVIPARGGSKGIPRKNMRLMHGRPLIDYAISCAAESSCITDVAVSTDSREILDFVEQIDGVVALERSPELSGDDITLDPVVTQWHLPQATRGLPAVPSRFAQYARRQL